MGTHAAVAWEWRRVTKIGAPAVKRSPHAQAVDRGQAPPSRPRLDYRSAASRTAVNLDRRRRAETAIDELRAAGVPVVAVETVAGAPYAHEFAFPPPPAGCALLLGNERRGAGVGPGRLFPEESPERLFKLSRRHGLAPELLARCDAVVRLPCRGLKNSLNVAVALGMCAHEAARQWAVGGKEAAGDAVGK